MSELNTMPALSKGLNLDLIVNRPATLADKNLIFSTWLLGLYHGNELFHEVPKDIYFAEYKKVVTHLLMKSQVTVACLKDDPDVVLGYVVTEGATLHWVFVKKAWRKLGIATTLVPINIKRVTHLTKLGKSLKPKEFIFDPFNL